MIECKLNKVTLQKIESVQTMWILIISLVLLGIHRIDSRLYPQQDATENRKR